MVLLSHFIVLYLLDKDAKENAMKTITVRVNSDKALKLLEDLEALHLIQIIKKSVSKKRLSEKFAGSLHLSEKQYHEFQQYLEQSRGEWERGI